VPQFDLTQYSSQIFWLTLCFTILYAVTVGYMVPRIKALYEKRWHQTVGLREQAEALTHQAVTLQNENRAHLEAARQQALTTVTETLKRISKETLDQKTRVLQDIREKFLGAELRISEKKSSLLPQAHTIQVDITQSILDHLLVSQSCRAEFPSVKGKKVKKHD
jgi:F-type H+-transporting ATPase subunit b